MNHSPKSRRSLSSDSSTDSIASSALKTPLDGPEEVDEVDSYTSPAPSAKFKPLPKSNKMTANALATRLELLPKRAATVPTAAAAPPLAAPPSLASDKQAKTLGPQSQPSITRNHKHNRLRSESTSSMASNASSSSALLRATLLMASPSLRSSYHQHHHSSPHPQSHSPSHPQPHSRAQSTGRLYMRSFVKKTTSNTDPNDNGGKATPSASGSGPTPSLLTPRTSISSFASTSLSSPKSFSLRDSTGVPRRGSRDSGDKNSISSEFYERKSSRNPSSVDVGSFAAEATTAISTQTSSSLAQFSPTPGAKTSLLQFGVNKHERASTSGLLSASTGNVVTSAKVDTRRSRSRGPSDAGNTSQAFFFASPSSSTERIYGRQEEDDEPQFGLRFSTWFGKRRDLPSISRALEPDTIDDSPFGGMEVARKHHASSQSITSTASKNDSGHLKLLSTTAIDGGLEGGALATTPRPTCPIDSHSPKQLMSSQSQQSDDVPRISALDKGKGRARPLSPTLTRHASEPGDSRLYHPTSNATNIASSSLLTVPNPPTSLKPTKSKTDGDLPTLAAIESGSRLMRQKIVCATCGNSGPDFPRCGRCGEAWCSRDCRTVANKHTGGKHRCCASVA